MEIPSQQTVDVTYDSDISVVRQISKTMAAAIGFNQRESEEISLVAVELASNLVRHAVEGRLTLEPVTDGAHSGIKIESMDKGPGVSNVEEAIVDGFTTAGGLGYGLGTANRLMDNLDIASQPGSGTRITCQRWLREQNSASMPCPLEFGVATRPHPRMMGVNGDAFVIKQWAESALVGVIDGLGHGQWAHRAAQTAHRYVESHFDRPLADIFRGVGRECRPTRGAVMALARFDWVTEKLSFASIGNIEVRVFNTTEPLKFIIRRGIIGLNAPTPVLTEHDWKLSNIMVLHSDGVKAHWKWEDFPELAKEPANVIAQKLVLALARDEDDATVVVVRNKQV